MLQGHKYLQESGESGWGQIENSPISAKTLYLTADPAMAEDMVKLVPTEVIIQEL